MTLGTGIAVAGVALAVAALGIFAPSPVAWGAIAFLIVWGIVTVAIGSL